MAYFISVSIELFSSLIETHSDKIERKRKLKPRNKLSRRLSIALSINEEVDNDLELLKALEIKTESEENDILNKLLTMTEFYNEELGDFFKASRDDSDQLNQLQSEKISKYEDIFAHLIEVCNEMNLNTSLNSPSIKSQ
jgi:protein-tyrosine phosphatase